MKYLKYLLYALGSILGLILIVAIFLPSSIVVERSAIVNRNVEDVFDAVNDLNNYDVWTPWNAYEKDYKKVVSKNASGVGSKFTWEGDSVGAGSFERTIIVKNQLIESEIHFIKPWESKAKDKMKFETVAGKTKISWSYHGNLDYPFGRLMGLFMDNMIGKDFQAGVDNIAKAFETGKMGKIFEINTVNYPGQTLLCVSGQVNLEKDNIPEKLGAAFSTITKYMAENKIDCLGAPLVITTSHSDKKWGFYAGMPVNNKLKKTSGDVMLFNIPPSKVLKIVYLGPYDKMVPAYKQMHKYMADNKLTANGLSWEEYISDPTKTSPDKLLTNIYYPVK